MSKNRILEPCNSRWKIVLVSLNLLLALPGFLGSTSEANANSSGDSIVFAVIGDYGVAGNAQSRVSAMIKSHNPDFIITTGDNNYEVGSASTIDQNVGQYYCEYIYPYVGSYCPWGPVAEENRFFPALGNHDFDPSEAPNAEPYLHYFTLPEFTSGNERYYDFVRGPVHFVVRNSETDPDGKSQSSAQGQWAKEQVENSTSPWTIVYQHKSPYSSGIHGDGNPNQFWPVHDWGADAVISGHDHDYERILRDGIVYFINGIGGGGIRGFEETTAGSQVRYNADHGAMIVSATPEELNFRFYNASNVLIDEYILTVPEPSKGALSVAAMLTLAILLKSRRSLADVRS